GSGFLTHGLPFLRDFRFDANPPAWSTEFDAWAHEALEHGDLDELSDFVHRAPAVRYAHPRTEHLAPLFVTLGAGERAGESLPSIIEGYWMGLSKRSIQVPCPAPRCWRFAAIERSTRRRVAGSTPAGTFPSIATG